MPNIRARKWRCETLSSRFRIQINHALRVATNSRCVEGCFRHMSGICIAEHFVVFPALWKRKWVDGSEPNLWCENKYNQDKKISDTLTHRTDTLFGAVVYTLAAATFSEQNAIHSFMFSAVDARISNWFIHTPILVLIAVDIISNITWRHVQTSIPFFSLLYDVFWIIM